MFPTIQRGCKRKAKPTGLIGVIIGLAIGAALIFWEVPVIFSVRAMLLAFGCAVITGLVFGYMPARTAARLDPVVALGGE